MKDRLVKVFPYVFGFAIGWLFVYPPAWFRSLGWMGYLLLLILNGLLLISMFAMLILVNLPADIKLEAAPDAAISSLQPLVNRMCALGFVPAGPPLRVGVSPPALLLPYMNETWSTYGTIYRTGTLPPKTAFEFITILEGERGALTTLAEPGGDVLPTTPGMYRQVFPRASMEELFQHHGEAINHLHNKGLYRRAATVEALVPDMKKSFARTRQQFLSAPLLNTLMVTWRSTTKQVPHLGSITTQKQPPMP